MSNQDERDEFIMTLVDRALQQPPDARSGYLRAACSNSALLEEVRKRVIWEEQLRASLGGALAHTLDAPTSPFAPDELVAGRFRILREVGRGGMGVVYEALDLKLERRVALKTAQPGHGHHLPPEARAAREVSHFNVCKVHDLHAVATHLGEVEFLSMEFLEGETLSRRIRHTGPLTAADAREIALQICAGLAQAHRQGVVHGDLKCGNIILTQSPEGGMRAVVTDFGLASLKPAHDPGPGSPSGHGGTRDYMAPELFTGGRASVASDIYALGVVFHEMLTGKTPGWSAPPASIPQEASTVTIKVAPAGPLAARQRDALPSPWDDLVRRCLATTPEARFPTADVVAERLLPRPIGRRMAIAAAPVILAALALTLWPAGKPPDTPVRLAVLPPVVEGGPIPAAGGLAIDVADRLTGVRRGFVVIPPTHAARFQVDGPEAAKAALGATHVLRTRLVSGATGVRAFASIVDTSSGAVLPPELKASYSLDEVPLLAKALAATVTGTFHLSAGVPVESVAPAAYPAYVQGLSNLRTEVPSTDHAIAFFQRAILLDPRSALPYAGLAEAQLQKVSQRFGSEWLDLAGQSVARAQALNPDSPLVLLAAGLYQQLRGQYEQAARHFLRAVDLAPNNPDAWSRLAAVYASTNRPAEAIATYRKAIKTQPRYYLNYLRFALFYHTRGELKEAEQLYRQVIASAPGQLYAHMNLGLVLSRLGRPAEAEQSLREALRLQENAHTLGNLAVLYYQQERYEAAAELFEKSLRHQPNAIFYEDLGDAYRHLGRRREAAAAYRKAWDMNLAALAQNPRDGYIRARTAFLAACLGDRSRALSEIAQALAIAPDEARVIRYAAFTFETLGRRDKTLEAIANAPARLLEELSRAPDLKQLQADPKFQDLLKNKPRH
jgi:tetratricopeptide (TPR) repeat protein